MGSTVGPNFEDVLPTMNMPCLVYVGEDDPRLGAITRAAGLMPNVTFFTVPERDHSAMHRDAETVVSHAVPFLANVPMEKAEQPLR
jgi:pimeloyl-ACP methyl ester carboxylesterase